MRLHHLSASVLEALNSTTEDEHAVGALLDTEKSRRLLTMRAILDAAQRLPDTEVVVEVREAWDLLERAEKADPAAFQAALLDPQLGLWAASVFRRLFRAPDREPVPEEPPLWVELGFLGQFAAAVAFVAGVDFSLRVPVRAGTVFLPRLGQAYLGDLGEVWGSAEVRARDGVLEVAACGKTVVLPADPETDAPGWQGLRRLRAVHDGLELTLCFDDLVPYAAVPLEPAGRLSGDQFASWQRWFTRTWQVLVRDHPASARALARGLQSVVPLSRGERLRVRAASSSDAFGCVLLSEPDPDEEVLPAQLGVALVHEFRHTLLNGLILLVPLFEKCDELFHAPWRDDPRPLGGLVHGAYAFSGVVHYWLARGAQGLAGFEFALWRDAVREVLGTLRGHPALTPLGRELVHALSAQTEPWGAERVGEREERLARLAAAHHVGAWRAHHLRMEPAYADELARAWADSRPARSVSAPDSVRHPDPKACHLDALALLARLSIIDRPGFDDLCSQPDPARTVSGVGPGDLALVDGHAHAAVKLYAEELAAADARPAAWAGLGLALTETGELTAGAALTEHPERALAVSRSLSTPPDPVALARWLGE